ncbi:hypothetical protein D3C79_1069560 [compost metagenome]
MAGGEFGSELEPSPDEAGVESLTVITSVCVAPLLNAKVKLNVPVDCACRYDFRMTASLPVTV